MNLVGIVAAAALGGASVAPPAPATNAVIVQSQAAEASLTVARGAKVQLMVINEVSTKVAKPGDRFLLRVSTPVLVGDRVIVPAGSSAYGEVISATESGIAGRSGKLATRLLHLEHAGNQIKLSGEPGGAGQGGNLQIVLATLALTPWGLFARGNNAKLKAGDIVTGYFVEDYPQPLQPGIVPVAAPANAPIQATAASTS